MVNNDGSNPRAALEFGLAVDRNAEARNGGWLDRGGSYCLPVGTS